MIQLPEVMDVCIFLLLDLLDGHELVVELANEDSALGP